MKSKVIKYKIFGIEMTLKGALENAIKWINENNIEVISIIQRDNFPGFHKDLTVIYKEEIKEKNK